MKSVSLASPRRSEKSKFGTLVGHAHSGVTEIKKRLEIASRNGNLIIGHFNANT